MAYTDEELRESLKNAITNGDREGARLIDAEIQKRSAGRTNWKDIGKSFAGGYGNTLLSAIGGGIAAKAGIDPRQVSNLVEERLPNKPQTRQGEYAKAIGAGASFGPGGVPAAVAGGAGGALAEHLKDLGYNSPLVQIAAFLAPSTAYGLIKGLHPGAAQRRAEEVLRETTPMDLAQANSNVAEAGARGVQMPVWQGAPQNSPLRAAGEQVVQHPAAAQNQAALMAQQGLGDQAWVKSQTDANYQRLNPTPVDPTILADIRRRITDVARTRYLDPQSGDANVVANAAARFGNPPPTNPPTVRTAGNILSLKQELRAPPVGSDFQSATQATRGDIAQAVDEAMNAVPEYTNTQRHYGRTMDIAEIMSRDARLRGSRSQFSPQQAGDTSPMVTGLKGYATNVPWSMVRPLREMAENAVVRKIDEALAARDIRALERLASEHPQWEGLIAPLMQTMRSQGVTPSTNARQSIGQYIPNMLWEAR